MSRIILVGYRGTGKTTVGRLLAGRLGWTFTDADTELEVRAGRTIAEIFAAEGESGFRDREAAVLAALAARPDHVIATGGGAVLRPANRGLLRAAGFVAWLHAPAQVVWDRIRADPATAARRPALTTGGLGEVVDLMAAREPFYREVAAAAVDAAGPSPEAVAGAILAAWTSSRRSPSSTPPGS